MNILDEIVENKIFEIQNFASDGDFFKKSFLGKNASIFSN